MAQIAVQGVWIDMALWRFAGEDRDGSAERNRDAD
jgi:hypothetical protein